MSGAPARPLAVVTGASSGIGLDLARECAAHGFDLVVAADEEARIRWAAEELGRGGAQVTPVHVDLATAAGVEALHAAIRAAGRPVDALLLNAGAGTGGAFTDVALADDLRVIDLDVRGTVHLAKLVVPAMVARGEGRVLMTSSIAAALPGAYQATYNASKAFVQSFALALRAELRGSGVTVTTLMPGPTDTPFFARNGMDDTRIAAGPKDDPADVAADGFRAMMAGDERVVSSSLLTKVEHLGSRFLPDSVKAQLHRIMSMPGSG
ncbi:MAG: putative short-chain dehydrogenase [Conexibacter sp.]|nr:putative short-chain dehydrogenase [Conexibacter sp.]